MCAASASRRPSVDVRATRPGEGRAVSVLWRELWDAHEAWGGYAGSQDQSVYDDLARRLDDDARLRAGQPVLGRHVHLIATLNGSVVGQVEGWFERHGVDVSTPYTCEVRSLVVSRTARDSGAGRALLDRLASTSRVLARGSPVFLAAEVLEPNPAHTFYDKVGYTAVSWAARIVTAGATSSSRPADASGDDEGLVARMADPKDALGVALLDSALAGRRRSLGDLRFDGPHAVDATLVGTIASHLAYARNASYGATELVVVDRTGHVRASATLALSTLEPPFLQTRRAILGRMVVDPAAPPGPYVRCMMHEARVMAGARGAAAIEVTDLTPPGTPFYEAVMADHATPWSRVVGKLVSEKRSSQD